MFSRKALITTKYTMRILTEEEKKGLLFSKNKGYKDQKVIDACLGLTEGQSLLVARSEVASKSGLGGVLSSYAAAKSLGRKFSVRKTSDSAAWVVETR